MGYWRCNEIFSFSFSARVRFIVEDVLFPLFYVDEPMLHQLFAVKIVVANDLV